MAIHLFGKFVPDTPDNSGMPPGINDFWDITQPAFPNQPADISGYNQPKRQSGCPGIQSSGTQN